MMGIVTQITGFAIRESLATAGGVICFWQRVTPFAAGHLKQSGTYTGDGWSISGNAGTTPGANFPGTTDN
jgi:hypothetical protein